jgi:predicted metalloprotease with PDZ domain
MSLRQLPLLAALLLLFIAPAQAAKRVDLDFTVKFMPEQDVADVELLLADGSSVRYLDFNLGDEGIYSDFQTDAEGSWQEEGGRGVWRPAAGKARLSYRVKVSHQRKSGRFDARMTDDWALLRGDDLVPSGRLDQQDGVRLVSRLKVELPEGWKGVETGWPRIGKNRFRIDNRERLFDRPTGWILAGKLGSRRARLGETDVTVAGPVGEGLRRMDVLTLLTFVWPEIQNVFPRDPKKLLVVGAGDPMWRGGLSGPNSLFMHADRPLVSENGTSSLVHELVHVFSRITDADRSDWISEGLAEYYAIELMRRAGGMSEDRYQRVREHLTKWSRKVDNLRTERSSGPVTARAVLLLQELDREIRQRSKSRHSLDDVARGLMRLDKVTTEDFINITETMLGGGSAVLDTRLLR